MARFLFTVLPVPGHVYPHIAVARALRDRGHECAFYTGSRAASLLASEGFAQFPYRAFDEDRLYDTLFSPDRGAISMRGAARYARMLREWLVETIPQQVADLEPILREWRPDVIATDPTVWSPVLVFRDRDGARVAVCTYFCCMVPGPDAPPFGFGLPRPRSLATRLLAGAASGLSALATSGARRRVNALRRQYGLPPLRTSVQTFMGTMPLYLVPSAPEFDYERRNLPPSVHYVGPYLFNKPSDAPPPAWLDTLRRGRPWVHATEGTVHVGDSFVLRAAAQGLDDLPIELILTTGGTRDPEELDLGPISPNTHLARWIAHSDLLPRIDLLITTGGAGSVLQSLAAGVPMIVIPTDWDKPELAQRVAEAGAGLRLSPRRCTPRRLRAAVERILGDPAFRRNAQKMARVFASLGGAPRAAELLEELAADVAPRAKSGQKSRSTADVSR